MLGFGQFSQLNTYLLLLFLPRALVAFIFSIDKTTVQTKPSTSPTAAALPAAVVSIQPSRKLHCQYRFETILQGVFDLNGV